MAQNSYSLDPSTASFERTPDTNLPKWLQPALLEKENFNAAHYVSEVRKFVPLEILAREFENYIAFIKAKLIDVINANYSEYVSLSSRLTDVDVSVQRMKRPLIELKRRLEDARATVHRELETLHDRLEKRKEVASSRGTLELLQDANHVVNKIRKLLVELGNAEGERIGWSAQSRLVERVASEVAKMNFLAATGKDLSYVRRMGDRMQIARDDLRLHMVRCLDGTLQAGPGDADAAAALPHLLHAFGVVSQAAAAERVLRERVSGPAVRDAVRTHLAKVSGPAGAPADVLVHLLPQCLAAARAALGSTLEHTLTPESLSAGYGVLGTVVLAEITSAIVDLLPAVFSPAVPAAFLANYSAGQKLLSDLEGLCPTKDAMAAFRASDAFTGFQRRWNLSVYFSLRLQDIVGQVEGALQHNTLVMHAPPGGARAEFGCQFTAVVWDALRRCFEPEEVFVPALSDKFLRLALQLLSRYSLHVVQGLETFARARPADGAPHPTPSGPLNPDGSSASDTSRPVGPGAWAHGITAEDLSVVRQDLEQCATLLAAELPRLVSRALPPHLASSILPRLPSATHDAAAQLRDLQGRVLALITAAVAEKCSIEVRKLRGITATYRMSARPVPSKPSMYVASMLQPLTSYLGDSRVRNQSEPARVEVVGSVAREVTARFVDTARDLLETVRKTEESLRRLKKTRGGAEAEEGGEAAMSDSDKLALQLRLDVHEFGRQLAALGVPPATLEDFARLEATVGGPPPPALLAGGAAPPPLSVPAGQYGGLVQPSPQAGLGGVGTPGTAGAGGAAPPVAPWQQAQGAPGATGLSPLAPIHPPSDGFSGGMP